MRETRLLMGMPITVIIVPCHPGKFEERTQDLLDSGQSQNDVIDTIFNFFVSVDNRFSTYKKNSEISRLNRGEIQKKDLSKEMKEVFALSQQTKEITEGFFDIQKRDGTLDPSGMVKGWAIWEAAKLLKKKSIENFSLDAGGDVQVYGSNAKGEKWKVGIKNPFNQKEIVKIVELTSQGIATSGTYIRGQHIYNPHHPEDTLQNIVSVTVIGPNVYEADRFATAAFAMQEKGIYFLERQKDLAGYMIDRRGTATMTSGFEKYVL